jgi:DNA-binding HxlR family transcriptional regulator
MRSSDVLLSMRRLMVAGRQDEVDATGRSSYDATLLATIETVLHNTYEGQTCSVARALEVVGERWTLLILRDAFLGIRRFDDFQRSLGVARNVLNTRLQRLVDAGILERRRYQQRPERFEYRLTDMGSELWPTIVALMHWGDRHLAGEAGAPLALEHRGCGGRVNDRRICEQCGAELLASEVRPVPGPGADAVVEARLGVTAAA